MMFARHNTVPHWQDPADFNFEPSPVWLDDDSMAADQGSKTFLMNILTKSKSSLGELRRECDARRKEVEGAKRVRQLIREGRDKRDEVEVVRLQLSHQELLHESERKMIIAEVQVSTILSNVGDVSVGAKRHAFKNETFRLPTNCDLCGDRIWGLSAKGHACGDCGFTCHTKCELKVPADCPGELNKEQRKTVKAERQAAAGEKVASPPTSSNGGGGDGLKRSDTIGSMNTLSSGYAASAHRSVSGTNVNTVGGNSEPAPRGAHRVVAPPPLSYKTNSFRNGGDEQDGKMLYAYTATTADELSIQEGEEFVLVEPDDGSGWIRIRPSSSGSRQGLVPASYASLSPDPTPQTPTSPFGDDGPMRPSFTNQARQSTTSLAPSTSSAGSGSQPKKVGPVVAPRRAKKQASLPPAGVKYVQALYAYAGGGPGETSMEDGERLVLVAADGGDGWCEVEGRGGRGVVPAGWVREV